MALGGVAIADFEVTTIRGAGQNSSADPSFSTSIAEFAWVSSAPTGSISDNDPSHDKLSTNSDRVGIFHGQTFDNAPIRYLRKITIEATVHPIFDFTDPGFPAAGF